MPNAPLPATVPAAALCLLAACAGERDAPPAAPAPEAPARGPNVVLITLDTTRADRLGAYGGPEGATPNLDALAARGVVFENAYTVAPLTIPAHASLMTGLLPRGHGVRDNGDHFLGEGAVTLAERFQEAGYATMASVGAYVTTRRWGFAQGFDAYFDDLDEEMRAPGNAWELERPADAVVDDALTWLEARDRQPFLAWLHLFDPHHPYRPREEWAARFPGRPYLAEIAFADHQIGRLLAALERGGRLAETWIVVAADHGEGLGEHGEPLHGVLLYDSTVRVPLIAVPPGGLGQPRRIATPVSLADLMPTLLGAAGLPIPRDLDGRDLSPWLGPSPPGPVPEAPVHVESEYPRLHFAWAPQAKIVLGGWKLHAIEKPELYPLEDRRERRDLARERPDRVRALQVALEELRARTSAPRPGISERIDADAELHERLAALGYVSSAPAAAPGTPLPDPRENLPVLRRLQEVQAAMREGRHAEAATLLEQILARAPGLLDPRAALAQVHLRLGRPGRALAVLDEGIARARAAGADNANLHALRGVVLARLGRREEAVADLEAALALAPRQVQAWSLLVELVAEGGDLPRAGELARQALAQGVESAAVLGVLGAALAVEGRLAEAEATLISALERRPDLPWARYHLGRVHLRRGDLERAEEHLLEEVRLQPGQARPRLALAALYARRREYARQIEQLEAVLKRSPKDADLWFAKAQALFNLGRLDEADRAIGRCLGLDRDHPSCHMLRANVLARSGRREEAEVAADLARQLARERGGLGALP